MGKLTEVIVFGRGKQLRGQPVGGAVSAVSAVLCKRGGGQTLTASERAWPAAVQCAKFRVPSSSVLG
jgi:hypothetical protein